MFIWDIQGMWIYQEDNLYYGIEHDLNINENYDIVVKVNSSKTDNNKNRYGRQNHPNPPKHEITCDDNQTLHIITNADG